MKILPLLSGLGLPDKGGGYECLFFQKFGKGFILQNAEFLTIDIQVYCMPKSAKAISQRSVVGLSGKRNR